MGNMGNRVVFTLLAICALAACLASPRATAFQRAFSSSVTLVPGQAERPALVAQSLSGYRQRGWVFVGSPGHQYLLGNCTPQGWQTAAAPGGLAVQLELGPYAWETCERVNAAPPGDQLPGFSSWVFDEPARLVPEFRVGQHRSQKPVILSVETVGPAIRIAWRTRILVPDLTIDGWWTAWPGQDSVDVSLQAVWATTETVGMSADLDQLVMVTGERSTIDHHDRRGLGVAWWVHEDQAWHHVLSAPRAWGRGSRLQWSGALLCVAKGQDGDWNLEFGVSPRMDQLIAREHGPLVAVSGAWAGSWGALGELPLPPSNAAAISAALWHKNWNGPMGGWDYVDEYTARPLAQPKESGTTGEQPDFGCSGGWEAAVQLQPWQVFDYRWQVQAWGFRPYANRESDGRPVRANDHPRLVTYNLRPDARLGQDLIGWPRDVPYSWPGPGYTTSDDQHRSDNLLVAAWQLTRDPAVGAVLDDMLEMDLRRFWYPSGSPIGSPRGWGRPMLAWAHCLACGFPRARQLLDRAVADLWAGASYRRIPQDSSHTVRVLGDNEAKYGWTDGSGQMIRAWLGWQEGIAAIGLWAAHKQLASSDISSSRVNAASARAMAITISETIVRHSFYEHSGRWWTAYAVRWREDDPGAPLPPSSYWPAEGPNLDVYTYGIQRWMLGSVRLVQAHSEDPSLRERAARILAAFPSVDWADARWLAIGP